MKRAILPTVSIIAIVIIVLLSTKHFQNDIYVSDEDIAGKAASAVGTPPSPKFPPQLIASVDGINSMTILDKLAQIPCDANVKRIEIESYRPEKAPVGSSLSATVYSYKYKITYCDGTIRDDIATYSVVPPSTLMTYPYGYVWVNNGVSVAGRADWHGRTWLVGHDATLAPSSGLLGGTVGKISFQDAAGNTITVSLTLTGQKKTIECECPDALE